MPPDSGSTGVVGPLGELRELQQLGGLGPHLGPGQPEVAAVDLQVLPHRQLGVEVVQLRDDADPGPDARPVGVGSMPSTCSEPPLRGDTQAIIRMVEDLPAPLGPRKPNTSPRRDVDVDAAHGLDLAEALAQSPRLDQPVPHARRR